MMEYRTPLSPSPGHIAGATAIAVTLVAWAVVAAGPRDTPVQCGSSQDVHDLVVAAQNLRTARNHAQNVAFGGALFHAAKIGPVPGPAYESAQAEADENLRLAQNRMHAAQAACVSGGPVTPPDLR